MVKLSPSQLTTGWSLSSLKSSVLPWCLGFEGLEVDKPLPSVLIKQCFWHSCRTTRKYFLMT